MKEGNQEQPVWGFRILSESWYYESIKQKEIADDVMFGLYFEKEGGCDGEICMQWHDFSDHQSGPPAARFCCFGDAFHLLPQLEWLPEELAKHPDLTVKQFTAILLRKGFKDLTNRENPHGKQPKKEPRILPGGNTERRRKELATPPAASK